MTPSAIRRAQFSDSASIVRRLKRRIAPWIEWQTFQCLTLSWHKARFAGAALTEPPAPVELKRLDRSALLQFPGDPVYDFSLRFLHGLESREDRCFAAFAVPMRWLYVYKLFTRPSWRGRRLGPFLLLKGISALEDWLGPISEPIGLVTLVLSDNHASLNAFGRVGFEKRNGVSRHAAAQTPLADLSTAGRAGRLLY